MAEGSDLFKDDALPNINTTDLLTMLGGESLTDIIGDSIGMFKIITVFV